MFNNLFHNLVINVSTFPMEGRMCMQIAAINETGLDIVFYCLGCPRCEVFPENQMAVFGFR